MKHTEQDVERVAEAIYEHDLTGVNNPTADLMRRVKALEKQVNHLEAALRGHEKNVHEGIREYLADLNSGQRHIRDEIEQLRKWAYRRFEELTPDKPEPHLPTPEDRDPRIDGPIGIAYARYDSDDRVNGPDDFSAFADALDAMERDPEENPYTGMTIAEAWTVIAEDLRDVLIERQHELEKPDDPLQLAYATLTGVWVEWRSYYVPDYGCYEAETEEVDLAKAGEAIRNAVAAAKEGE